jgi:hypothetical protein
MIIESAAVKSVQRKKLEKRGAVYSYKIIAVLKALQGVLQTNSLFFHSVRIMPEPKSPLFAGYDVAVFGMDDRFFRGKALDQHVVRARIYVF